MEGQPGQLLAATVDRLSNEVASLRAHNQQSAELAKQVSFLQWEPMTQKLGKELVSSTAEAARVSQVVEGLLKTIQDSDLVRPPGAPGVALALNSWTWLPERGECLCTNLKKDHCHVCWAGVPCDGWPTRPFCAAAVKEQYADANPRFCKACFPYNEDAWDTEGNAIPIQIPMIAAHGRPSSQPSMFGESGDASSAMLAIVDADPDTDLNIAVSV